MTAGLYSCHYDVIYLHGCDRQTRSVFKSSLDDNSGLKRLAFVSTNCHQNLLNALETVMLNIY